MINNLTLDGVMQAPGRPEEDTRHDFSPGGWSVPYSDEVIGRAMGGRIATSDGLLLGRRTYEAMPTSTGVVIATYRPVSA